MLNKTQQNILEATLQFPFEEINELPPSFAIKVFKVLLKNKFLSNLESGLKFFDVYDVAKQIKDILEHPYPQNRSTSSPYVGQEPGYAVCEPNGHGNGITKEPLGLLSLTARNDNSAPPVTREDVVNYIRIEIEKEINKITSQLCLHKACEAADLSAVATLLAEGIDPNANGKNGFKPIHIAAIYGNITLAEILFDAGADVEVRNQFEESPIHWAAWMGNLEVLDYLASKSNPSFLTEVSAKGKTPLMGALNGCHLQVVSYLLKKGISIKGLIDRVNSEKELYTFLLIQAISNNKPEFVKECLSLGADIHAKPSDYQNTPVNCKVLDDHLLFLALSKSRNPIIIRALLDSGVDIDAQFHNGNTPLISHFSSTVGWTNAHHETTKILLEYRPNLDIMNKDGDTALDAFVFEYGYLYHPNTNPEFIRNRDKTLEVLLEANASTNKKESVLRRVCGLKTSHAYPLLQKYFALKINLSAISFFNRQEVCGTPMQDTKNWNLLNTDTSKYEKLQPNGPGFYGF